MTNKLSEKQQRLLTEKEDIAKVASALSSEARLAILEACSDKYMSVTELASLLKMPQSTVTNHIQILEENELITTRSEAGRRGRQKLCKAIHEMVCIPLPGPGVSDESTIAIDMPVGLFTRVHVEPPCGLASASRFIGEVDFPGSFLLPERVAAGIVWFAEGWVEYSFPRSFPESAEIETLEISFEACSEAKSFNHDWPSDISVWLNDVCLGTWSCPSDYGRPRGMLNPVWWPADQTQYGELKTWKVTREGTYLDGQKVSDVTPNDLKLMSKPTYRLRIGVDKEAKHQGGVNLFGDIFGNHEQGINVVVTLQQPLDSTL